MVSVSNACVYQMAKLSTCLVFHPSGLRSVKQHSYSVCVDGSLLRFCCVLEDGESHCEDKAGQRGELPTLSSCWT